MVAQKDEVRLDLRAYNKERAEKLNEFDFSLHEQLETELETEVSEALQLEEHCWTKNLTISLFWEEKIFLLVRAIQMYSLFFIVFYEFWPSYARIYFTPFFMAFNGSF